MSKQELVEIISAVIDKASADGCEGCAYVDVEEWELPCCKCARCCKDYYRLREKLKEVE